MMIKITMLIIIFTTFIILITSSLKAIIIYKKNINLSFKDKVFILPKSFITSTVLVPMISCWLFFIHTMFKLTADHSYLIIFCCIFIPLFHWWMIKNIGD